MKKDHHPAYLPCLYLVALCGIGLLILSAVELLGDSLTYHWMILASLTVITGTLAIKIPGIDSRISIEDTFFFTNLVLFGPQAGTITAALQGLVGSIRAKSVRRRLEFTLFNTGALALSAYVSGQVFYKLLGSACLFLAPDVSLREIILPVWAATGVHYLCNTGSVAVIIALDLRKRVYEVWAKNFRWTSVTYFTGATVAALIAVHVRSFSPELLGLTIPIVVITYFTYNTYKQKIEENIRRFQELSNLYLRTVECLALAVDAKDQTTYGHVRRVRAYSLGLARLAGVTDTNELLAIETGSLLHDIGKLTVDDYILNKPDRLNRQEFERMKAHTVAGEEILNQVEFPYPVAKIVRSHHERWDGQGYPDGLQGRAIPLGARILTIADVFDAIRSPRPYKLARGIQECLQELRAGAGSMYDPELTELFIRNIDVLEAEAADAVHNMREMSFRAGLEKRPPDPEPVPAGTAGEPGPESGGELVSFADFCAGVAGRLCLADLLVNLQCRLQRLVPFNTCAFFLDAGDGELRVFHAGGEFSAGLQNVRLPLGTGISGWVAAYGRPLLNARAALEFQRLHGDFGCLSHALVVPLRRGGCCLGSISLYAREADRFNADHLGTLQHVANQAAPVVARALEKSGDPAAQGLLDPVTGAYRAAYLAFAGAELVAASRESSEGCSLLHIEILNFTAIAEARGPRAGDSILGRVSEVLRAETRAGDVQIRLGDAGFVILLKGVRREQISRRLEQIGQRISSLRISGGTRLSFRAGAASFPEDGDDIFGLLDSASREKPRQGAEIDIEEPAALEFPNRRQGA